MLCRVTVALLHLGNYFWFFYVSFYSNVYMYVSHTTIETKIIVSEPLIPSVETWSVTK